MNTTEKAIINAPALMRDMLREMLATEPGQKWAREFYTAAPAYEMREMFRAIVDMPEGETWAREYVEEMGVGR